MSVETMTTWACDGCRAAHKEGHGRKESLPSGWTSTLLHRRVGGGLELHFLLLCLECQEKMLIVLKGKAKR